MSHKTVLAAVTATATMLVAAAPALAYVGPGAGLSLIGALWGVVAAIVAALAFMVIWPVRRLIVKRRAANRQAVPGTEPGRRTD